MRVFAEGFGVCLGLYLFVLRLELRLPLISDLVLNVPISCFYFIFFKECDYSKTFVIFIFKHAVDQTLGLWS